jgi:hypothetical protein
MALKQKNIKLSNISHKNIISVVALKGISGEGTFKMYSGMSATPAHPIKAARELTSKVQAFNSEFLITNSTPYITQTTSRENHHLERIMVTD